MTTEINLGNLVIPIIKPEKGKDYYTETEKQELISIVTDNVNSVVLPQEQTRQENEATRQSNEETRQSQENTRQSNEVSRQTAESARVEAENLRQSNEASRISAEQARVGTFNTQMQAVDTAIGGIHTSQDAYDQNAQAKTEAFNTNATNKINVYNENASEKIDEYDEHVHDYETELANKVDKVQGKGLSTNDYDNTEKGKVQANTEARHTHSNKSVLDGTTASYTTEEKAKLAELENYNDTELREDIEQNVTSIDDLEQRVEDAEKNQLTNTPTPATSHYLQDSADSRFRKFIPIGRTTQESTTGKNKFSSELELGSIDNSTGLPSSSAVDTCLRTKDYISVQPSTTYTIKNNKGYYTFLYFYQEDKTYISYSRNTTDTVTFTTDSNTYFIKLRTASDRNENDITAKYMLNTGSTAEPYEQFTGGEPAPNPIYPYAIKNTGDNVNLIYDANHNKGTSITQDGITYTVNNDGSISVNGTATVNSSYYMMGSGNLYSLTLKPGTYVLSGGISSDAWIRLFDGTNYYDTDATTIKKFTITDEINAFVALRIRTGTTINATFYPKLEQGTKATPYSPYGCGSVNEKVQNANIWDEEWEVGGINSSNGENYVSTSIIRSKNYISVQPNTQYYIKNSTDYAWFYAYDKDKNFIGYAFGTPSSVANEIKTTFSNCYYLRFQCRSQYGTTYKNDICINVSNPSINGTYIPHEEQNISFPLAPGQKLMEGSYPDDDEKVHHNRMQIVLDGSDDEVFDKNSDTNEIRYYLPKNMKLNGKIIANYFMQMKSSSDKNYVRAKGTEPVNSLMFKSELLNTDEMTIPEWRQYLSEHNLILEIDLDEEQTEDFIEGQKTAWEEWKKARTYKNVTHISSEDETPANVEIEYVQDTKTYIDNKVTALTNAITSLGGNV